MMKYKDFIAKAGDDADMYRSLIKALGGWPYSRHVFEDIGAYGMGFSTIDFALEEIDGFFFENKRAVLSVLKKDAQKMQTSVIGMISESSSLEGIGYNEMEDCVFFGGKNQAIEDLMAFFALETVANKYLDIKAGEK